MEDVTKIEIEIHKKDDGYVIINLTPDSEEILNNMTYDNCIIMSHMFAQLSYNIMAKETVDELEKLSDKLKSQTTVCDLFGAFANYDNEEIKKITESAIQSGIDIVKRNAIKEAANEWQECLLGGLSGLLSPERDTSNKRHKYLTMIPIKPTKFNKDYVQYFNNILPNIRNYYSSNMTTEELEGYIVNILSLIIEEYITKYTEATKTIPDEKFFNSIQQHIIKITTEALSVITSQIKDAYKESKLYKNLSQLAPMSQEAEAELIDNLDFRDILRAYEDSMNKLDDTQLQKDDNKSDSIE